jgi:hypothetical protein
MDFEEVGPQWKFHDFDGGPAISSPSVCCLVRNRGRLLWKKKLPKVVSWDTHLINQGKNSCNHHKLWLKHWSHPRKVKVPISLQSWITCFGIISDPSTQKIPILSRAFHHISSQLTPNLTNKLPKFRKSGFCRTETPCVSLWQPIFLKRLVSLMFRHHQGHPITHLGKLHRDTA